MEHQRLAAFHRSLSAERNGPDVTVHAPDCDEFYTLPRDCDEIVRSWREWCAELRYTSEFYLTMVNALIADGAPTEATTEAITADGAQRIRVDWRPPWQDLYLTMRTLPHTLAYLKKVEALTYADAPTLSKTCPECGNVPANSLAASVTSEHALTEYGHVVVGCEGYFTVRECA